MTPQSGFLLDRRPGPRVLGFPPPGGLRALQGVAQLLDAAGREQPAITRPAVALLPDRGDRRGATAETGGLHNLGTSLVENCVRDYRIRDGPGDMLMVPRREKVPFQEGRIGGCQAAFTCPYHHDPFLPLARLQ